MALLKRQFDAWMKRAIEEKVVNKKLRPVRFELPDCTSSTGGTVVLSDLTGHARIALGKFGMKFGLTYQRTKIKGRPSRCAKTAALALCSAKS